MLASTGISKKVALIPERMSELMSQLSQIGVPSSDISCAASDDAVILHGTNPTTGGGTFCTICY